MRAKVASKLAETLVSASSSSDVDPELAREISVEIESEMWDALGKTPKEYTTKGRSLVFNLSKNAELRRRVLQRQITATKLVSATSKELAPEQIKLQRAASIDRYYATRVQGDSSERLVGWQAGTSGKLERSHKFDETEGGPSEGGPPKSEGPYLEPDDTLSSAALFGTAIRDGDTIKLTQEFDFDSIAVFGLQFDLPKGGAESLGAASGLGAESRAAFFLGITEEFANGIPSSKIWHRSHR